MYAHRLLTALLLTALLVPAASGHAKRSKPKDDPAPAEEPATFQVYGFYLQEKSNFGYGDKFECDLTIYVVEGGQPVVDATVTVGDLAVPHDSFFEGRYRVQQSCVDPGTALPVRVVRGNQVWTQARSMPGYPVIQEPAAGARAPVDRDLSVRWLAADGAPSYRVTLAGVEGEWYSSAPQVAVPKTDLPPFCHHDLAVTALGSAVDRKAETRPLSMAESVWPGVTPMTRVTSAFDFGPSLVGVNWAGQAGVDGKLHKVWMLLDTDGSYRIRSVAIGTFEQAMLNGNAIEWLDHDSGTYRLGEGGSLLLESADVEGLTWTAAFADPTLTVQKVLPPTEDPEEIKKRKRDGRPAEWELKIEEVEPVEF